MLRVILLSTLVAVTIARVPLVRPLVPQLDGRIVGGQPTTIEKYPYQLSLQYLGSHICGASIIGPNVALTAAHCTDGSSAVLLSIRAASTYKNQGGQVVKVSKISQNPNYNSRTTDYDISVLHLAQNINLGSSAQIVGLPALNQNVPEGTNSVVSGWGALKEGGSSPSQLQVVTVPIISVASCKSAYGSSRITDRMICAGYTSGGKDACQGDSGGPLVASGQQIGIVSWGSGCARPKYPGVYSSVPNLRNYIKQVAGI